MSGIFRSPNTLTPRDPVTLVYTTNEQDTLWSKVRTIYNATTGDRDSVLVIARRDTASADDRRSSRSRVARAVTELDVVRRCSVLEDVEPFELAVLLDPQAPRAPDRSDAEHHDACRETDEDDA